MRVDARRAQGRKRRIRALEVDSRRSSFSRRLAWLRTSATNHLHACISFIYRVGQKSKLLYFFYIFAKYWPIFTIFSLVDFVRNLLLNGVHTTLIMSLHYHVNYKYPKTNNSLSTLWGIKTHQIFFIITWKKWSNFNKL